MSIGQLKETLKKLHERIHSIDKVDAELTDLLSVLSEDIQQLLDKEHPEEDALSHLEERTVALSAKFAARNPHLESILRELNDILVRMGI